MSFSVLVDLLFVYFIFPVAVSDGLLYTDGLN